MSINLIGEVSSDIKKLFEYVVSKNLHRNFNFKTIEKEVLVFYKKNYSDVSPDNIQSIIDDLENYSFRNNIIDFETGRKYNEYTLIYTLSQFKAKLIKQLNPNKKLSMLKRLVSPPLEAYEYTGHNNLNFTPSKRDYGLLFE